MSESKPRARYTLEFKLEAVRLGKGLLARGLDVTGRQLVDKFKGRSLLHPMRSSLHSDSFANLPASMKSVSTGPYKSVQRK